MLVRLTTQFFWSLKFRVKAAEWHSQLYLGVVFPTAWVQMTLVFILCWQWAKMPSQDRKNCPYTQLIVNMVEKLEESTYFVQLHRDPRRNMVGNMMYLTSPSSSPSFPPFLTVFLIFYMNIVLFIYLFFPTLVLGMLLNFKCYKSKGFVCFCFLKGTKTDALQGQTIWAKIRTIPPKINEWISTHKLTRSVCFLLLSFSHNAIKQLFVIYDAPAPSSF